jgi:hypothetical protein
MRLPRALCFAVVPAALASPAWAVLVPGGGNVRTDCYAEFEVRGVATATSARMAECTDGDPSCDRDGACNDTCRFDVALCANQTNLSPSCVPPFPPEGLRRIVPRGLAKRLAMPVPALADSACAAFVGVDVPVKVRRNGRVKRPGRRSLRALAVSPVRPRRDPDVLRLVCNPPAGGCGGAGAGLACPANGAADQPNEIRFTVAAAGTDLDNGRTGTSHNFPTPAATRFQMCLAGCDASTAAACTTSLPTGPGTFNGTTFGAPLPLFTAGIPVCVVNRYAATQEPGAANLQTGAIDAPIALESDVFLTDDTDVCPRCETGTCNSGPNRGRPCSVDGQVTVSAAATPNKDFKLSKDCPPPSDLRAGTLRIRLPLTTGTSTLAPQPGGSPQTPCVRQAGEPAGLTPQPDSCPAGGTCTAACSGDACASMGMDFVTGAPVCVDRKGGISQVCCSNSPTTPCFPTGSGGAGVVERVGRALVPTPPWPAPEYPKATACAPGSCTVLAGSFCEAATGTGSIDGLTGLPGPGAILLPVAAEWRTAETP